MPDLFDFMDLVKLPALADLQAAMHLKQLGILHFDNDSAEEHVLRSAGIILLQRMADDLNRRGFAISPRQVQFHLAKQEVPILGKNRSNINY
jgi:hypothetical protein